MAFGDLTTLADVKAWLSTGQQAFPPTDDALLTRLITAASGLIQTWLKRSIVQQDWFELRDGPGTSQFPHETRFQFGAFPVTAVSLVVVDNVTVPAIPPAAVAPPGMATPTPYTSQSGYLFTPTQLVIRGYPVPRKAACVTMQYTAGFATVPGDIAQACIELVCRKYRERTRIGERSRSLGGQETVSYETVSFSLRDMASDIQLLLSQYRMVAPVSSFLTPATT
jgi:hypothetical protein